METTADRAIQPRKNALLNQGQPQSTLAACPPAAESLYRRLAGPMAKYRLLPVFDSCTGEWRNLDYLNGRLQVCCAASQTQHEPASEDRKAAADAPTCGIFTYPHGCGCCFQHVQAMSEAWLVDSAAITPAPLRRGLTWKSGAVSSSWFGAARFGSGRTRETHPRSASPRSLRQPWQLALSLVLSKQPWTAWRRRLSRLAGGSMTAGLGRSTGRPLARSARTCR